MFFVTSLKAKLIKNLCLAVFLAFATAACKPKQSEQVIADRVVEPEQVLITGQIFIVTAGRANVVLGAEKIAVLEAAAVRTYVNSKAVEWSNALAIVQTRIDKHTKELDALYKDDLAKFTAAKAHYKSIMDASSGQRWLDAYDWYKKMDKQISNINKLKRSSDAGKLFAGAMAEQEMIWDTINWPSAEAIRPSVEIATTDGEGRFRFVLPASRATSDLLLMAKSKRRVVDDDEEYWWLVPVNLKGKKTSEIILSNDNMDDGEVSSLIQLGTDSRSGLYLDLLEYRSKMRQSEIYLFKLDNSI